MNSVPLGSRPEGAETSRPEHHTSCGGKCKLQHGLSARQCDCATRSDQSRDARIEKAYLTMKFNKLPRTSAKKSPARAPCLYRPICSHEMPQVWWGTVMLLCFRGLYSACRMPNAISGRHGCAMPSLQSAASSVSPACFRSRSQRALNLAIGRQRVKY